jgi:pimeloyl-ACP methyl ester carboxylesterase
MPISENVRRKMVIRGVFYVVLGALMMTLASGIKAPTSANPVEDERLIDVGGFMMNSLLLEPAHKADLPPIVFIHGASTSLYDPLIAFRSSLERRARLLFVDRPGHGRSQIGGKGNILPDGQADAIASLMDKRGIKSAIVVGHSYGGAIAAALALRHPEKVKGLVFLSPAVYDWPGGVSWYYDAARIPITGVLFSTLVAPPAGLLAIGAATKSVFAPNPVPQNYIVQTKALQALRPVAFRHNALEVASLNAWAKTASRQYSEIKARTIIITGDADKVVSPEIHSKQLARAIKGSKLLVVHNLGHKPDYIAGDLVVAAIEVTAGKKRDLSRILKSVERRIADDRPM